MSALAEALVAAQARAVGALVVAQAHEVYDTLSAALPYPEMNGGTPNA